MVQTLLILIFVGVFAGCSEKDVDPRAVMSNNKAVFDLAEENDKLALQGVIEALSREPFHPQIQMNLGLAYEILEDFDRAYQAYGLVLNQSSLDPETRFQALFNQARVEGARKNIDEALALYQDALKIYPLSVEVKHNIELLISTEGEGGGEGGEEESEGGGGEGEQPQQPQDQEDQPKPDDIDPKDIEQILEELSRQEQKIRAKEMDQEAGEPQDGKNW